MRHLALGISLIEIFWVGGLYRSFHASFPEGRPAIRHDCYGAMARTRCCDNPVIASQTDLFGASVGHNHEPITRSPRLRACGSTVIYIVSAIFYMQLSVYLYLLVAVFLAYGNAIWLEVLALSSLSSRKRLPRHRLYHVM